MSKFISAVISTIAICADMARAKTDALKIYGIAVAKGYIPYLVQDGADSAFGAEPSAHLCGSGKTDREFLARLNNSETVPCDAKMIVIGEASELPALLGKLQGLKEAKKPEVREAKKKTVNLLDAKKTVKKAKIAAKKKK